LDPVFRPLQIFATDPADSKLDGTRVVVDVPYEEVMPGPVGSLFEVVGRENDSGTVQPPLDLNDARLMCTHGLTPEPSAAFQMQMTYAVSTVTYEAFRRALGRDLHWGFDTPPNEPARLKLYPFCSKMSNAFYDRESRAIHFGWYDSTDRDTNEGIHKNFDLQNLRKGNIFTSLSHDIIVHEVSHALLDGLRPNFLLPYHKDTLALHEGFADLIAILQHFSHRELLAKAICKTRGKVSQSNLLTDIARQFGQTQSNPSLALRSAVDDSNCSGDSCSPHHRMVYNINLEIHELGSVLVSAIFDAFSTIFDRKIRKYIQISTHGSGVLPEGELEPSLADVLAKEASDLARQFLGICIRAIDYCPPISVTFGDYLRAMITADFELVPNDPLGYREALVDAFIRREIPIEHIDTLSESALIWPAVFEKVDKRLLSTIQNEYDNFMQMNVSIYERYRRRADVIGHYLTSSSAWGLLGLDAPESAVEVRPPCIESARIGRRVGPDGQLAMDLIVEVTREIQIDFRGSRLPVMQGSTVIISPSGEIRYVISKDPHELNQATCSDATEVPFGMEDFWKCNNSNWISRPDAIKHLHMR
jgi:hypothetical protein